MNCHSVTPLWFISAADELLNPMTLVTKALMITAIVVPAGPAIGKDVVPGITKARQPIIQLRDKAHTSSLEIFCQARSVLIHL